MPSYSNYPRDLEPRRTTRSSTVLTGSSSTNSERALALSELRKEDQEKFRNELQLYRTLQDNYTRQSNGIRNILTWMLEKVSPSLTGQCAPSRDRNEDASNIALFFANLRDSCGVDEGLNRRQNRRLYREVLNEPLKGNVDWNQWITKWDRTVRKAKIEGVPEAQHPETWFEDLQVVLQPYFGNYLDIQYLEHKAKITAGTLQPATITLNLQTKFQQITEAAVKTPKERISKGSFRPTFSGTKNKEKHPDERAEKEPKESSGTSRSSSKSRNRKHGKSESFEKNLGARKRSKEDLRAEKYILYDRTHYRPNSKGC